MEGNLNQEDGTSQKVAVKTMKRELTLFVRGAGSYFSIWCFIRPVMDDGVHMSWSLSSHRGRATIMNCSYLHRIFFSFLMFCLFMYLLLKYYWFMGFPGGASGKETAWNAGDKSLIPGMGRSAGEGNGNPLQYSCLEDPHGQRSLVGYSPWCRKELGTSHWVTEQACTQLAYTVSGVQQNDSVIQIDFCMFFTLAREGDICLSTHLKFSWLA